MQPGLQAAARARWSAWEAPQVMTTSAGESGGRWGGSCALWYEATAARHSARPCGAGGGRGGAGGGRWGPACGGAGQGRREHGAELAERGEAAGAAPSRGTGAGRAARLRGSAVRAVEGSVGPERSGEPADRDTLQYRWHSGCVSRAQNGSHGVKCHSEERIHCETSVALSRAGQDRFYRTHCGRSVAVVGAGANCLDESLGCDGRRPEPLVCGRVANSERDEWPVVRDFRVAQCVDHLRRRPHAQVGMSRSEEESPNWRAAWKKHVRRSPPTLRIGFVLRRAASPPHP